MLKRTVSVPVWVIGVAVLLFVVVSVAAVNSDDRATEADAQRAEVERQVEALRRSNEDLVRAMMTDADRKRAVAAEGEAGRGLMAEGRSRQSQPTQK